jgi:hypothetical protein
MANNKHHEKYTRELLTEAVANSIIIAGVLRYLQIPIAGGTHAHISRKLKQFGIDTSHFLGQAHTESAFRAATRPRAGLVVRPLGAPRPKPHVLRRALRESGVPYTCEACGVAAEWNGKPIILHVDHVSGDWLETGRRIFAFSARTATRKLRHSPVGLQTRRGRSPIGQEAQALGA